MGSKVRKRRGLNKAIANTSPEQAASNLEKLGLDLDRYKTETKNNARKSAAGYSSAEEPLTIIEIAAMLQAEVDFDRPQNWDIEGFLFTVDDLEKCKLLMDKGYKSRFKAPDIIFDLAQDDSEEKEEFYES